MDHNLIRDAVEEHVLPTFQSVFRDIGDGKAPTGEPLDEWLKKVSQKVQASVEKQVSSFFDGVEARRRKEDEEREG